MHLFRKPVLVYQMGKVGSTAIHQAVLKHLAAEHIHSRMHFNLMPRPRFQALRSFVNKHRGIDDRWQIITLTRDPIAQCVGAFFEAVTKPHSGWFVGPQEIVLSLPIEELVERFNAVLPRTQRWPRIWFRRHFLELTGIGVYAEPFDAERGFKVYENDFARALLIRYEDLERVGGDAIAEFLGIQCSRFKLERLNESKDQWYGELKQRFLEVFKAPDAYIEKMYTSRYVQHFYTPQEIAKFEYQWKHPQKSTQTALT